MDADERAIYYYIKSQRPKSTPVRDICRRAARKRRYHYNPGWANPVLLRMVERGILETDAAGDYCLKPLPPRDTQGKRWASPQMIEILKASGKQFDNILTPRDEDDEYDKL
jgi:hypothetical protein